LRLLLGLQIKQSNDVIYKHQTLYINELQKELKLFDAKEMKNPIHPTIRVENESTKVVNNVYKKIIWSPL